ncbi:MAG: hypothetical protein E5V60_00385 [Mesorhizobium sp.]|nr:MAG: hypothetical protein EOR08_30110 [Mesorhizobium sp.]TIW69481.1 MAG: hypothetical protein E5V60_00385 [Mesorhizobium sp.]
MSIADLSQKHGVSGASIYNWKARFVWMHVSEARRRKALEDQTRGWKGFWPQR